MIKAIPQERPEVKNTINVKYKEVASGERRAVSLACSSKQSDSTLALHNLPFNKITPRIKMCFIIHQSQTEGDFIAVSTLKSYVPKSDLNELWIVHTVELLFSVQEGQKWPHLPQNPTSTECLLTSHTPCISLSEHGYLRLETSQGEVLILLC